MNRQTCICMHWENKDLHEESRHVGVKASEASRGLIPGCSYLSPQSISSAEWSYKFIFWTGQSQGSRTTGGLTYACDWVGASQVGLKRLSFRRMMCNTQIPEAKFCSHVVDGDFVLSMSIRGRRKRVGSGWGGVDGGVPLGCGHYSRLKSLPRKPS